MAAIKIAFPSSLITACFSSAHHSHCPACDFLETDVLSSVLGLITTPGMLLPLLLFFPRCGLWSSPLTPHAQQVRTANSIRVPSKQHPLQHCLVFTRELMVPHFLVQLSQGPWEQGVNLINQGGHQAEVARMLRQSMWVTQNLSLHWPQGYKIKT